MMKKPAKTRVKVVWSIHVLISVVPVCQIPRDRKLMRNAEAVNDMARLILR